MHNRSRRCTGCDVNWPDYSTYGTCPGCGQDTWECRDSPLDAAGANNLRAQMELSRKRREEFDRYYVEREARLLAADLEQWAVQ